MEDTTDISLPNELPAEGIFADLTDEVRGRLSAAGRFVNEKPGTYLAVQGQKHQSMAVILTGKVAITAHAHGDTVSLATLSKGQSVGEMSVLDPRPASANVRVVEEPATLWIIDGDDFDRFIETDKDAGLAVLRTLARELCQRLRHDSETMLRRADENRSKFLDMDY